MSQKIANLLSKSWLLLQERLATPDSTRQLLRRLGWEVDAAANEWEALRDAFDIDADVEQLESLLNSLRYRTADELTAIEEALRILANLQAKVEQIRNAGSSFTSPVLTSSDFWQNVAGQIFSLVVVDSIQAESPLLYLFLRLTGAVREVHELPVGPFRVPYTKYEIDLSSFGQFISKPDKVLADHYSWGSTNFDYKKFIGDTSKIVNRLPIHARVGAVPAGVAYEYYTASELRARQLTSLYVPVLAGFKPDNSGFFEVGLSLTPIPAARLDGQSPTGLLLAPLVRGQLSSVIHLRPDLILELIGSFAADSAVGVEIYKNKVSFFQSLGSTAIGGGIQLRTNFKKPLYLFGYEGRSRVELSNVVASISLTGAVDEPEVIFRIGTGTPNDPSTLRVVLQAAEGDSFISQIIGSKPVVFELKGIVSWSSRTGIGFEGGAGLSLRKTVNKSLGPFTLNSYSLVVHAQSQGPLSVAAAISGSIKIGPLIAVIDEVGVGLQLIRVPDGQKGALGKNDIKLGFKAPVGIGIIVESDTVKGGGYLYFDPAAGRYAGVAEIAVLQSGKKKLGLIAIGLLQTKLPNQAGGYSLLLLITAEFSPVQLGLGFTLSGVGGLVGLHRTMDVQHLRDEVRSGGVSRLLFPANVLDNASAVLATVDASFPVAKGRFTFGLLAKIGWGTPTTIITADLGLLVEMPAPVRVVILGSLRILLPDQNNDLIRIQADFIGVIDFGSKRASFDATLAGSRILWYALTGDLAFRMYWGNQPLFLITAGGFHPAYQPPAAANLPALQRLTLALAQGDDFRLTLFTYMAVTSSTVQFGSRLELFADLPSGFSLVGFFAFDTLFYFNPFRLQVNVAAGVAIRRGGKDKLSLYLSLDLTGPAPWHAVGEGYFKVLCFKVRFRVDRTFGGGAPSQPLPGVDVRELLKAALKSPRNWTSELPALLPPGTVILRTGAATSTTDTKMLVNPRGTLTLRQQIVPLGYPIERYGNAQPINGRQFTLRTVTMGSGTDAIVFREGNLVGLNDFFAPGQLRAMSNSERLSAPGFQLMRSGAKLTGQLEGMRGGAAITRSGSLYEQAILRVDRNPGNGGGVQRMAVASGGNPPGEPTAWVNAGTTYQMLAKHGAVGRSTLAREQRRPSRQSPDQVFWGEDRFVIVDSADLTPFPNAPSDFANEASATAFLKALVADQPSLTSELEVVPAYQLDLV